jgi:hypothetical protein
MHQPEPPDVPEHSPEWIGRRADAFRAVLEEEQRQAAPAAPRRRRWRASRWRLAPVGIAVAVIAIVAAASLSTQHLGNESAVASADEVYAQAAQAARHQHAPKLGPDQYWHIRTRRRITTGIGTNHGTIGVTNQFIDESWIAPDGHAFGRMHLVTPPTIVESSRKAWAAEGHPPLRNYSAETPFFESTSGYGTDASGNARIFHVADGVRGNLTFNELRRLPRDPERMYRFLHGTAAELHGSVGDTHSRMLETASILLGRAPLDPAQRAAIFRALRRIPGARLASDARDALGRRGEAITYVTKTIDGRERIRLIIDPRRGRLLEREAHVLPGPGVRVDLSQPNRSTYYDGEVTGRPKPR